ncbi:MAG: glycerophosphodiester phosphodiesterase family protein [Rhizobiaceae bacterium]|nr:glycerophosphodiester phosphodiesterase family protein [Rhizobiaceae bacterium]
MRLPRLAAAFGLFCMGAGSALADGHADAVLARLENANGWRDHVMVVAHRGGWKEGGAIRWAENSRAGVEHVIALGAEMVELDVRASRDGVYVVMHDSWLDRTTTCRGEVETRTLAELRDCRLVVEGSGIVTGEAVPTLAELLRLTRDRILVNIDNKLGPDHIAAMLRVARELGMQRQVILKENVWDASRLADIGSLAREAGSDLRFMPIIADDAVEDPRFVETVSRKLGADSVEMVAWRGDRDAVAPEAGPLFGARTRAAAVRGNWHIWVNTYPIVNKPGGFLAQGRGDELAVAAGLPAEVYGYWAEHGATIIQTDEPKAAIEWLDANGYRRPYDLLN